MLLRCDNLDQIRRLREAFDAASYTAKTLSEHIRWTAGSNSANESGPVLLWNLRNDPKLRAICSLFLMQIPVSAREAIDALAPASIESLIEAGLLRVEEGSVHARLRIVPTESSLALMDLSPGANPLPDDYVMGPSSSTSLIMSGTIRKPVKRMLDLCAGSGIQSLEASAHSETVTAVEKNVRAIQLGKFCAILNGKQNIEFRESDFYSAVEGERFDLIVANPPFVIAPGHERMFLDGGLGADRVVEHVVRNAPRFPEENGYCQLVCDWANYKEIDSEERLRGWVADAGCDMLVMRIQTSKMSDYPAGWLASVYSLPPAEYHAKYREWIEYYEREGIESMSSGLIFLRRRSAASNWFHLTSEAHDFGKFTGAEAERLFAAKDFLEDHASHDALLSQRLTLNKDVRFDQRMIADAESWTVAECALAMSHARVQPVPTDPYVGGLCSRLRGDRPLRDVLAQMAAALRVEPVGLARQILPMIRDLIERGYLDWK